MKRLLCCLSVLALMLSQSLSVAVADCGSPGFRALTPFATGATPKSIIIGDFNLDGTPDIATANNGSGLSVILGRAGGGFNPFFNVPGIGVSSESVVVRDFNLDGKPDAIVPNSTQFAVGIAQGNGLSNVFNNAYSIMFVTGAHPAQLG